MRQIHKLLISIFIISILISALVIANAKEIEKEISNVNTIPVNGHYEGKTFVINDIENSAIELAASTYAEHNKLQIKDIDILDTSIYHSTFSNKKWYIVKLEYKGKGNILAVDADTRKVTEGWDSIEEYEQQNKEKVGPVLRSILANISNDKSSNDKSSNDKSSNDKSIEIIIVLKDQPKIRNIVTEAENKYSDQLNKALNEKNKKELKDVVSNIRKDVVKGAKEFDIGHGQNDVVKYLNGIGATIIITGDVRNHIVANVSTDQIETIAQLPEVETIEPILEGIAHTNISIKTINADWVWQWVQGNNYTGGAGILNELSVFDSGIDKTHPAFANTITGNWNYVSDKEGTTDDLQGHGTHVAGIAGSRDSIFKGVAPGVRLLNEKVAYKTPTGIYSPFSAAILALSHSYGYTSEIVQYSYGWYPPSTGQDYYSNANGNSEISRTFDAYVEAGLLSVISAGDNGSNYYTISVPGDAYNVITVGNINDKNTVKRTDDSIAISSSRGYTGDGRTKPDVVAPGSYIISANNNWEGTNPNFVSKTGTSMAAPHVSGMGALLVDEWARMYQERLSGNGFVYGGPLAIRAIIYNSADDTIGENTVSYDDRSSGTGYVDAKKAWQQTSKSAVKIISLSDYNYYEYITLNPGDTLKATVTWNRHVDMNTKTPKSMSDLDLKLSYMCIDPCTTDPIVASSSDANTNWEKITYRWNSNGPNMMELRVRPYYIPSSIGTETAVLAYSITHSDPISIGEAVDNTGLSWQTSSSPVKAWYGQNAITYDRIDAAQSGDINHDQDTYMQTTVSLSAPKTLKFYWRVSSEPNWDWLEFYIDDVRQNRISGNIGWQQKSYSLNTGQHTLRWRYVKDNSVNSLSDAGWVDKVQLI